MVIHTRFSAALAALALFAGFAASADAQTRADCERDYRPQRGQDGKDVVWMPTEDSMVVRLLEMASVTASDKLYDLGSGDGKIPIAAAKHFGTTAVGIEYDAALGEHARCLAKAEDVQARVTFVEGDIFETDFSDATVVTLYLLPELNLRLRPTLLGMKPGTRVVSYSFTMGDWEPDDHIDSLGDGSAYLWIVPANVGGTWTFLPGAGGDSFDVELEQTYQALRGVAAGARVTGRLAGNDIELELTQGGVQVRIVGTVDADQITGTLVRGGASSEPVVGTRR